MRIYQNSLALLSLTFALSSCNFLAEGIKGSFSNSFGGSIVVMVDPYIEGATMCYDINENNFCDPDEPESSPSDSKGNTQFAINLPNNAKLIQKEKGLSNGKPFLGNLKTNYDPDFVYVTPITTMMANGAALTDIKNEIDDTIDAYNLANSISAPFSNVAESLLMTNPMAAVEENDPSKLVVLKASMAISTLLADNPDLATIAGDIDEKYSNINNVIGETVPNETTLKAAVVVQEYISANTGTISGAVLSNIVNQINNNPGKEIKLTSTTTVAALDVPAPKIVRLANNNDRYKNSGPIEVLVSVGGIKAGDQVTLYHDNNCETLASTAVTSTGTFVNILANQYNGDMLSEDDYVFYAKITNVVGETSCSSAFAKFTYDTTAPTLAITSTFTPSASSIPVSNSSVNISLSALFTQYDTYKLYLNNSFSMPIDSKHISLAGTNNISFQTITLPTGNYNFYIQGEDLAGNVTACHQIGTHRIDINPPPVASAITRLSPALTPSNINSLQIAVNGIETGANVQLFSGANCNSFLEEMLENGSNSVTFSRSGLTEGVHTFTTKVQDAAGNLSACSVALNHTVDLTPPTPPSSLARSNPTAALSSSTSLTILATGVAPTDKVRIYSDNGCNTEVGSAPATTNSVLVNLTGLANSAHTFYAKTFDLAGNSSSCSMASVSYQVDNISPAILSSISLEYPANPISNVTTPTIQISGVEIGSTVKVFRDASCSQLVGSKVAAIATESVVTTALAQGNHTLYARQTDAAGNNSPCSTSSLNYTVDTTAPQAPTVNFANGTVSPSGNLSPTLAISNLEIGSTVSVYTDASCTNQVATSVVATNPQNFTVDALVTGGPTFTFYTIVTDIAGNSRACTNSNRNYTLATSLSGVAAIGGPLRNARVTLYGSDDPGCSISVYANENGAYSMNNVTCQGPYLLKAENVAATLYSVATQADLGGVVNITPLTELVMNRVYPTINYGTIASIEEYLQNLNGQQASIASSILTEKDAVKTALQGLLNHFNLVTLDLIKTPFTANGSGVDALLNSIKVAPVANSADYAIKIKKSTNTALVIPASGTIIGTLADSSTASAIASDFTAIKTVLNNFDGCATSAVSDGGTPPAPTSASIANVENCINNLTHVDFMHDGNSRQDFAYGISEEYVAEKLLVQFADFHLMDMYVDAGTEYAQILAYVRDMDTLSNTYFSNYIEVYKMIKVDGTWKVYGNQMPIDFGVLPAKISSGNDYHTGYDMWGQIANGESLSLTLQDPHFTNYSDITLSYGDHYGYTHINVESGTPARAACAANSVHCNQFFVMPNGVRRPNFLKVQIDYDDAVNPIVTNTILYPAHKDFSNTDGYSTFTNLPANHCTTISTPQSYEVSLPPNHTVMGWSVGPTNSNPGYIDFQNIDWSDTSTIFPLLYAEWNNGNEIPWTGTSITYNEMHISSLITNPSGVVHIKNVSCGYTP